MRVNESFWSKGPNKPKVSPVPDRRETIARMIKLLKSNGLRIRGERMFDATKVVKEQRVARPVWEYFYDEKRKPPKKIKYYMAVVDRSDSGGIPKVKLLLGQSPGNFAISAGAFPEYEKKPHIVIMPHMSFDELDLSVAPYVGINPSDRTLGDDGKVELTETQYSALVKYAANNFKGQGIEQLLYGTASGN